MKDVCPSHRPTYRRRARPFLLAAIILISACARPPAPTTPSTPDASSSQSATPPAYPAAQQTCSRFAVAALSTDTATDQGPADARLRAALEYGTTNLAQHLAGEGHDHHWPQLRHHHARVAVTTTEVNDDPPPDHAGHTAAAVIAHRIALGADGWRLPLPDTVVYCSLIVTGNQWRITAITFDTTTTP